MAKRERGKVKQKSVKAALSSTVGSKRKLSRMGKRQKKGKRGLEATFIGRTQCLKRLQISLKDFRRLCILKGVYPRDPINRFPLGNKGQTYYHLKDIRAIANEPILDKFREFKAFMKKVKKAAHRNEIDEAKRKSSVIPKYTLHHVVKERYPRFIDALSDMDDALTLSYLFAALPSEGQIKNAIINKAKTLVAAWGAYCATTHAITKSFISVKGIYLEVTLQAQPIRWIVPHAFTQYLPEDVDYRVMMTFFEFYETLLNFVLFKLYNDIGVRYPFSIKDIGKEIAGSTSAILGSNLKALTDALNSKTDGAVSKVVTDMMSKNKNKMTDENSNKNNGKDKTETFDEKKTKEIMEAVKGLKNLPKENEKEKGADGDDDDEDEDGEDVDIAGPLKVALESLSEEHARSSTIGGVAYELDEDSVKRKRLFSGLTFFLSREVPRGYLELVGLAYGAKVGWEGDDSPITMKDATITHHFVDRPKLPADFDSLPKSREYVQPQWIIDCANFMFLLPVTKYVVGATLPPHLSPWVDDEEEGYTPAYAEEIERLKNGEVLESEEEENAAAEAEEADSDSEMEEEEKAKKSKKEEEESDESKSEEEKSGSDDDDEEEEMEEEEESEEKKKERALKRKKKEDEETHALAKTMMNKKAKRLYDRMQYGIAQKKAKTADMFKKRLEIEGKKKDDSGKSILKQKVIRLKQARKSIEDEYDNVESGVAKKSSKKKKNKK